MHLLNRPLTRRRAATALLGAGAVVLSVWPDLQAAPRRLHPARLTRALDRARQLEQLHSLTVARDGVVQVAEAFRGPRLERAVNVKSVSKTVVATLTGIALDRGVLDSVDQPVAPLLREVTAAGADPRLGRITVDHLLTMRAGLERTSGANYGRWVNSADWVRYAWNRPFVAEPGGRMLYSTGSYHLLAAVLVELGGRDLLALSRQWLGEPLGFEIPPWSRDPQGRYFGGNDMALSPNALLRLGEMYRQGGLWQQRQVVSAAWIASAWTAKTTSPFSGDDYGYGWFLTTVRGHPIRYARGYGGQLLYLAPALGLTVVITSDPNRPARSTGYFGALKTLLAEDIIAAAEYG